MLLFFVAKLFNWFKIACGMLAERTDEVLGKRIALIYVAAYFTNVALLSFSLWLGLYGCVIVAISHRFSIVYNARLINSADEHSV